MSSVHVVIPDAHAKPGKNNNRALWIGALIHDIKPDVVVDLGDTGDFDSLSSYDKGKRSFVGRSYSADVIAHNDFQDKLWHKARRSKKKLPRRVRLIGNHEQRIDRALDQSPELAGTIGYSDLDIERYYDDVVYYDGQTPGTITIDGVTYAHYFVSGVMGRSVSGEHPAHALVTKQLVSCTQGHTHTFDYTIRTQHNGSKVHGLVAGCCVDFKSNWAGETQKLWTPGVVIKRNVHKGMYDIEWVSLERLKKEYDK